MNYSLDQNSSCIIKRGKYNLIYHLQQLYLKNIFDKIMKKFNLLNLINTLIIDMSET